MAQVQPKEREPLPSWQLDTKKLLSLFEPEQAGLVGTYLNEAFFFWQFLKRLLADGKELQALEVGSGIGLLSLFASTSSKAVISLEPESSGFNRMSTIRNTLLDFWETDSLPDFQNSFLHELPKEETFDFIYCINVLEHVPQPEKLISEIYNRLNPGGMAWCVLPNYAFPYEQHFEVPIVISKSLTWKIFRKKIRNHSVSSDPEGMWSELSWPRQSALEKFFRSTGWTYEFRNTVLEGYFDRLNEPQFLERKGSVYRLLRPLIRMLKPVILALPQRVQPVIEFTISKPAAGPPLSKA